MPKINLITPPDKLYNENKSLLLISPSNKIKESLQDVLATIQNDVNVYLYELIEHDYDWLFSIVNSCNICILDCDNLDVELKKIESYLISKNNVFWLTNSSVMQYTYISNQRVFDLEWLKGEIENYESQE